jgi:hypothetical protein
MAANVAVYPKLKKKIVIDASNNKLSFAEGSGSYTTVTITNGTYYYPYTSLAADIKTQLEAIGALDYTIISDQQKWKISATGNFKIDKTVANSITTTLGFVSVVTTTGSTYYRADSIHLYTHAVVLLRTNTTSDGAPPYIDDGLFTTLVGATHRSRSFSGFIIAGGNAGDARDLYFSASMSGFSGLVTGSHYYTNGTAGQISTSTVANSLSAGYALNSSTLVIDPGPKDFEFQIEPDTDVLPNTVDDLPAWLAEPEIVSASNADAAYHGFCAEGDYVVVAKADTGSTSGFKISWSVDGGETFKEYGTFYAIGESWGAPPTGSGYWYAKPMVWCDSTGRVFIAYCYYDGLYYEVKGLYGTIDSNGELTLAVTNAGAASPYTDSISLMNGTSHMMLVDMAYLNGYLYVAYITTNRAVSVLYSSDYGATFYQPTTSGFITIGGSNLIPFIMNGADMTPIHLVVTPSPSNPTINRVGIVYSADNTNGDPIVTADYHLALAYYDSNTPPLNLTSWSGIDLGEQFGTGHWNIAIGKCWANTAKTKVAFNVIAGHGSGIAAGSTAAGSIPRGFIKLIDLSVSTPTQSNSRINYYDAAGTVTLGKAAFHDGYTSENTNGYYHIKHPNNIMWLGSNAFVTAVGDTYQNNSKVMHYSPDVVSQNNVSYPITNPARRIASALEADHLKAECQFVQTATKNFAIFKATESIANNLVGGRILAHELTLDTSTKTELITNGTFDSTTTGWTNAYPSTGSISSTSGRLRLTQNTGNAGAYQDITTVPGKTYILKFDMVAGTAAADHQFRVYSYPETNLASIAGDLAQSLNFPTTTTTLGFQIAFVAKSTVSRVALNHGGGALGTYMDYDNVSVKESDVQVGAEVNGVFIPGQVADIAAKPNVDDEDTALKIQTHESADGNAHVLFKKGYDLNLNGTFYEQPAYQNFKIRTEEVATLWEDIPHEVRDFGHTASEALYDVKFDPTNPNYGVSVSLQNGASQTYVFRLTIDGGQTWKKISTPAVYTDSVSMSMLQWYYRYPVIWINNSRVFICFETSSTAQLGMYGTITNGELALSVSNSGAPGNGTNILATGTALFFRQIVENNGKLYFAAAQSGGATFRIAVSSNYGQSWSDGVTTGSDSTVKNVGSNWSVATDWSYSLQVCNRPGAPTSNRVMVVASNGALTLALLYTDNDNLGSNWATAVNVSTAGSGTIGFSAVKLSDNKQYMAVGVLKSAFANKTDLVVVDVSLATPATTTGSGTDIVSTYGLAVDTVNGYSSALGSLGLNYVRHQHSKILWTSATSLMMINTLGVDTATPRLILSKCSDINNIASTITYANIVTSSSSSAQATEGQLAKLNGQIWATFVTKTTTSANWQTQGRARAVLIADPTPTTNVAPTVQSTTSGLDESTGLLGGQLQGQDSAWADLSNKLNHTGAVIGLLLQQLSTKIVSTFFKVNVDSYQSVFVNTLAEREINPLADEFAKVPVKITYHGTDLASYAYDRVGDKIVAVTQPITSNNGNLWYSNDGGATWFAPTGISLGRTSNNTVDFLGKRLAVKINSDGTKFVVLYIFQSGGIDYSRTIYGEFDSNGTMKNLDTTPLNPFTDANLVYEGFDLAERSGKLYAIGNKSSTNNRFLVTSSNFGDTSYGTPVTVKNGGSTVAIVQESPSKLDVVSNGSGGDRAIFIGKQVSGGLKMWYTNDDGANWATEIDFGIADSQMFGYGREGNQAVVLLAGNDGAASPNPIYVAYCANITATTPSWTVQAITNIAGIIGIGQAGQEGPNLSVGQTDKAYGHVRCLNRVIFTSATSFICAFDSLHSGGIEVPYLMKFHDVTNLANYQQQLLENASSVHKIETQLIKSSSGRMFVVYKVTDSASFANNLTSGRLVAREIYDPTPTSNVQLGFDGIPGDTNYQDIAYKPSATTGGFAGRMQIVGDTIMFEKEDGSGFEQIYIQSLSPKNNARFQ